VGGDERCLGGKHTQSLRPRNLITTRFIGPETLIPNRG
jgi:hypothetical protein